MKKKKKWDKQKKKGLSETRRRLAGLARGGLVGDKTSACRSEFGCARASSTFGRQEERQPESSEEEEEEEEVVTSYTHVQEYDNTKRKHRKYQNEEISSKEKYHLLCKGEYEDNSFFNLNSLITESIEKDPLWKEAEWGFPKGRRESGESDYNCAIREFHEETGYAPILLHKIRNICPYEEIFTGSNYKSYKHKYYVMYMTYEDSLSSKCTFNPNNEISALEWKEYEDCLQSIRFYNMEKKEVLMQIYQSILKFRMFK